MSVIFAVLAVAFALALAVHVRRARQHETRALEAVDSLTARVLGDPVGASSDVDGAINRLAHVLASPAADHPRSGDRYRGALESMALGVVLVDDVGTVRYRNPVAASFLDGRHGAAVVGQVIDELIDDTLHGDGDDREVQIYGPPRRRLLVSAMPILEGAQRLGAMAIIDDITERERLDSIRRDFVANISHELRTPIGAMSLLAETLAAETDPAIVASLSARINAEAGRLTRTIEDLLQLSRIEHGTDEHFERVILQQVVATARERVAAAADHGNVDIGVTLPVSDVVVRGDGLQLASAIFNLLDNAVKYSGEDGGSIAVRGRVVTGHIELSVQDSGIGIPRKDLDRVFERFYRVDPGRSRSSGGTGLGLAIVRHIVSNHGGSIDVESTEGEGTTFTIVLPALDPPQGQEPDDGRYQETSPS